MLAHVRDLAKYGVITDRDPYDLPTEAFSFAANVRFRNGKVESGPVYRNVLHVGTSDPRFVGVNNPNSGVNQLLLGYKNGRVFSYATGTETDLSISGYVPSSAEGVWSETHLADVYYVNREDRVPWYFGAASSIFATLPNWDATWRTRLLRVCGSALIALNVTKGSTHTPTMVKTSSIPLAGAVPASWDHTNPATNATENIIAEMEGEIIDACALGNNLFIYGARETWRMVADGSTFVFDDERVFKNRGAINANCSVEVSGKHYVFGTDDIWMHDGVTDVSISEGLVRDFIFDNIDITKSNRCFVEYHPRLREVRFHYSSGDDFTVFRNADGCNRVAVLSLKDMTWTFDDAPFVYDAGNAHISSSLTYATVTGTYDTIGGSYVDQDESIRRTFVYVGDVSVPYGLSTSLYAFDAYGKGSTATAVVDPAATALRYLERDGIDLDEVGADLRGYKTVSTLYPQARLDADAAPLVFTCGAADYFDGDPVYGVGGTYDGGEQYKLDPNVAGRYLAMKMSHSDYRNFSLSGFDIELLADGDR
jgi:hypothetical protein